MRYVIVIPCLLVVASLIADRSKVVAAEDRAADQCLLAENGAARFPVVVAQDADESTRQVAAELALYLSQVTGAKFDVTAGDGSTGIVLGTLAQFPDPGLNETLAIRDGVNGREAFAIRTEPNRLRLIGATELGVSHAAFRFLETLGCRWFFPAREWEIVPQRPTLAVQIRRDRPARNSGPADLVGLRFLRSRRGPCRRITRPGRGTTAWRHRLDRLVRTRLADRSSASNRPTFDAHPEYLALVKGKRQGPQFCVSNPEVRQLAIEWALSSLPTPPGTRTWSRWRPPTAATIANANLPAAGQHLGAGVWAGERGGAGGGRRVSRARWSGCTPTTITANRPRSPWSRTCTSSPPRASSAASTRSTN